MKSPDPPSDEQLDAMAEQAFAKGGRPGERRALFTLGEQQGLRMALHWLEAEYHRLLESNDERRFGVAHAYQQLMANMPLTEPAAPDPSKEP